MRRLLVIVIIVVVVAAGATLWLRSRSGGEPGPMEIQTIKVERGTVILTISADGALEPLTTVSVKSYAGGSVDALAVEVGDEILPGDLIAKIDPTDSLTAYEQAAADLAAAHARLSQAEEQAEVQPALTQAAINQAEASHNSTQKEFERMEKAAHPQTRAQVQAALDKAEANLDLSEKDLARMTELSEKGYVSQSEVDDALNRRDVARAELESAQERSNTLAQEQESELAAAQARVEQAKASLERARADSVQDRLRLADVTSAKAQVARAKAQVDNAKTMLEYTTIRAPRAGVILEKFVEQGTIITSGRSSVAQGTDIVLLGDLTKMFVEVSLDEADVAKVRIGQSVDIQVEALPQRRFRGVVTRVNPQAITTQNITTVLVTVQIANPGASLKPGMTATCDFLVEKADNALFLPSRAVTGSGGEYFVMVLEGGEPKPAEVSVGLVGNDTIEILDGLAEGDEIVAPGMGSGPLSGSDWLRERGRRMGGGGFMRRGN